MLDVYKTFYNLIDEPFRLSPDYEFCFAHRSYASARAYLKYAASLGEGCIAITGAPGMGKTTLVRELLSDLDNGRFRVGMLTGIQLDPDNFLHIVLGAFDLSTEEGAETSPLLRLERFLYDQTLSGWRTVLVIDEAQGLSAGSLEALRLLSNIQRENRLLLQVFLVGQEQLLERIQSPDMEHLRQRLVAACRLEALDFDETVSYVEHRLRHVGWAGVPTITEGAFRAIHRLSHGVPRSINLICNRLLILGGLEEKRELSDEDAEEVIEELHDEGLVNRDLPVDIPVGSDEDESLATLRKAVRGKRNDEASEPGGPVGGNAEQSADRGQTEPRNSRTMTGRRGWTATLGALGLVGALGLAASLNTNFDERLVALAHAFYSRIAAEIRGGFPPARDAPGIALGEPQPASKESSFAGRIKVPGQIPLESGNSSAAAGTGNTTTREAKLQASIGVETVGTRESSETTVATDSNELDPPTTQVAAEPTQESEEPFGTGSQSPERSSDTKPETRDETAKSAGPEDGTAVSLQAAVESERARLRKDAERRFTRRIAEANANAESASKELTSPEVSVSDEARRVRVTSLASPRSSDAVGGEHRSVATATSDVPIRSDSAAAIEVKGKPVETESAPTQISIGSDRQRRSVSESDRIRSFLLANKWHSEKGAAMLLPSEFTYCRRFPEHIKCWSVPRSTETDHGPALYKVEGRLEDFSDEGKFRVVFRTLVKRAHATPSATAEGIRHDRDWQATEQAMSCRMVERSQVQCRDEQDVLRDYWLAGPTVDADVPQ